MQVKNIFDIDCNEENADLVITPVPWDVTTSYGHGAFLGPELVLKASPQIDFFDASFPTQQEHNYFMRPIPSDILNKSKFTRSIAQRLIHGMRQDKAEEMLEAVNEESDAVNEWVYNKTLQTIQEGKIPATLGGDHSVPYGAIKAVSEKYNGNFSILHFDAHHDLRKAYLGFNHSHASIFYNVMESNFAPKNLTQMFIRDYCEEEFEYAKNDDRIHVFYDRDIRNRIFEGGNWKQICEEVLSQMADNIYISLDIDGFDPKLCPNTGTPVPGGMEFIEFQYLLDQIHHQKKKIIGFDLVEVSPGNELDMKNEWDGNVGMRVLYQLCKFAVLTK